MIERARWNLRADDPKTPLGWIVGVDRWHGVPTYAWISGVSGAFFLIQSLVRSQISAWWGDPASHFFSVLFVFGFMALVQPRRRPLAIPDPLIATAFVVSVAFVASGRKAGVDRGYLTFSEGWLLYEGRRTAFALGPRDVSSIANLGEKIRLVLKDGSFLSLSPEDEGLRGALTVWWKSPDPEGLSRLPPQDRHPETRHSAASWLSLSSAILLGAGIGMGSTSLRGAHSYGVAAILLGCIALSGLFAILSRRTY